MGCTFFYLLYSPTKLSLVGSDVSFICLVVASCVGLDADHSGKVKKKKKMQNVHGWFNMLNTFVKEEL